MKVLEDHPLQRLNTLALPAKGRYFVEAHSVDVLLEALAFAEKRRCPVLPLGGGSNLVLTRDFPGLVIKVSLLGLEVLEETEDRCLLKIAAGEDWNGLVENCLASGRFGLENLSLIPGTVGAAPIQNIGAYGVELAERVHEVETLDRSTGKRVRFSNSDCRFSYRTSIFKKEREGRHIILSVTLNTDRTPSPTTTYGGIEEELKQMGIEGPSPKDVAQAVCGLRKRKLPDPEVHPNAGSFFKNPIVSKSRFQDLKTRYPDLVAYPAGQDGVKLAAGWMIDRLGWKGFRRGDAGVHPGHALVLVNYGTATGRDILELAGEIQASVRQAFDVDLEIEPTVI